MNFLVSLGLLVAQFFFKKIAAKVFEDSVQNSGPSELLKWTSINVKFKDRDILDIPTPGNVVSGRLLGVLGPSGYEHVPSVMDRRRSL
jgi:hypothetical protein